MTLSAFTISALGMRAQATALHVIGTNVSNVQTGGYKRADAEFRTLMSETTFEQSDIGGVRPNVIQRNTTQGSLLPTNNSLDLAIIGDGFYITRPTFDATGEILYTRDGTFEKSVLNEFSFTDPNTGDAFTTKDAYLVDKNGNYLLGFPVGLDGTFPTTGVPAPMRVDQNAFIDEGTATTSADIGLNLDSNAETVTVPHVTAVSNFDNAGLRPDGMEVLTINYIDSNGDRQDARLNFTKSDTNTWEMSATYDGSGTAQVNTITIDGTVEIGDQYDVTVNGTTVSYTVVTGDTQAEIIAGLVAAVNADATITANVAASTGTDAGTMFLSANAVATTFTSSASSLNGPDIAQVSTATLSGTLEVGDVYSFTIAGQTVNRTVLAGDTTFDDVASSLIFSINATPLMGVTASAGTAVGEIILTGNTAGANVSVATSVVDKGPTAQVDTLTLAGTMEAGDVYTATINGTPISYTVTGGEGGLVGVRNALLAAINADGTVGPLVTAAAGGTAGEITVTAQVAGTPFTSAATAVEGGIVPDNVMTVALTTANALTGAASDLTAVITTAALATTNDDSATSTVRVAAESVRQSTPVTTITFSGDGSVVLEDPNSPGTFLAPPPVSLSFAIPATATDPAATASIDLDVTGLTQFAMEFLFQRYSQNGFEAASMADVGFDTIGRVVGFFDNGRSKELYQVPLARFSNPDALETHNGMTFTETTGSGAPTIAPVNISGIASFSPQTREISNVSLVDEFTAMIQTQQAYNSSAQAFKTADEMYQILGQMKR
jgi:flagellar hook protein FlgE